EQTEQQFSARLWLILLCAHPFPNPTCRPSRRDNAKRPMPSKTATTIETAITKEEIRRSGCFFVGLLVASNAAWARAINDQDKNKEIARTFVEEVLGQGHLEKYAESHSKDFVAHGENHDYSLEEDMAAAKEERHAMPDMKIRVNQVPHDPLNFLQ